MSISPKNEASQNNTVKRRDYISWDEYFMGIAMLSAMRSKDPNSQVGACIVRDNKILSLGYNGMPIGCDDDIMPWGREGNELETKYMYVCHSELNAILNAGKDLHGSTMYVTLFPCNECAKAIIQSGIKHIVYLDDKYRNANNNVAARQRSSLISCSFRRLPWLSFTRVISIVLFLAFVSARKENRSCHCKFQTCHYAPFCVGRKKSGPLRIEKSALQAKL